MRAMVAKSKKPGHLWPMAMYSWEVMPPPAGLEKNLGERRLTGYAGTGWRPFKSTAKRRMLLFEPAVTPLSHASPVFWQPLFFLQNRNFNKLCQAKGLVSTYLENLRIFEMFSAACWYCALLPA